MRIIVIGAGPKAAAIAARAAAWRAVRREEPVPEIEIIEQHTPGAAWQGGYGFSDGALELCNPGEKDVGFPYPGGADPATEAEVSREVARRFSWFSFLVDIGAHTEWVERGRPFPRHDRWARYIEWVLDKAGQTITIGQVTSAAFDSALASPRWKVTHEKDGASQSTEADALVLTGTGPAFTLSGGDLGPADGLVDAATFWDKDIANRIKRLEEGQIVVLGSGGAAGTILAHLASLRLGVEVGVVSLSPLGALFPRGDGYAERRLSSDPDRWRDLPAQVRQDILSRTDAGVVSGRIKEAVERSTHIAFEYGRATSIERLKAGELRVHYESGGVSGQVDAEIVVEALGFDAWGLLRIFGPAAVGLHSPSNPAARENREALLETFKPDLCLPATAGLGPRLHIPLLAARSQGPGYASLGSLGATARAILDPYVTVAREG